VWVSEIRAGVQGGVLAKEEGIKKSDEPTWMNGHEWDVAKRASRARAALF